MEFFFLVDPHQFFYFRIQQNALLGVNFKQNTDADLFYYLCIILLENGSNSSKSLLKDFSEIPRRFAYVLAERYSLFSNNS